MCIDKIIRLSGSPLGLSTSKKIKNKKYLKYFFRKDVETIVFFGTVLDNEKERALISSIQLISRVLFCDCKNAKWLSSYSWIFA